MVQGSDVGDERDRAPPKRYDLIGEGVGGASGGSCCHRIHVVTAAETVGEEKGVRVVEWCKDQRVDVIDDFDDAWAVG